MDRPIIYDASIPQDTDILSTNRNALVGLGMLALDIFGSSTLASGFACTPNSPASLSVLVAPGRLYSLQNIDNTAYGSLPADNSHQILKQGISLDTTQLNVTAPGTSGFSTNWLIQASYQDQDTDLQLLQYYNSQNIDQALSGPGNSGTSQATRRKGAVILTAKAGIPAATGSQTTPAPDAGNVGLWVVTVANGATQVTSGNISMYFGAPFMSGTNTLALTGCTTSPTTTMKWVRTLNLVTAYINSVTAISNSNVCAFTGVPPNLWPAFGQTMATASVMNNGQTGGGGGLQIDSAGVFQLILNGSNQVFNPSGQKGLPNPATVTWILGP